MSNSEQIPQPEPTIGKLVADASRDFSALIQNEIALAKSEVKVSVKAGGMGLAFVGAAVFLLLLVVILGSVTIAYMLTLTGMHEAWAFLIVTVVYLLLAGILGFLAWNRFQKVGLPEKTIETAKEIPGALKPSKN